jgi:hypothetical protein
MNRHLAALLLALSVTGIGHAQDVAPSIDENARFAAATRAVRDRDFRTAIALFESLAEADAPDAQFNLAVLLREGRGRPQNHVDALDWSALALLGDGSFAETMVSDLMASLPQAARDGVVARLIDRVTAQAEAGQTDAPRKLARIYSELMAEPDTRQAYIWFSICYAMGENRCAEGRDGMAEDIGPDALIDIQREAGETFARLPFAADASTARSEGDEATDG